jgi:hypothetical protein
MTSHAMRWMLLIALLGMAALPARAEDVPALYTSYAIVTGTDMRQRPWGFALCLRDVLVKVSGDPQLRDDPRVTPLAEHADRFVASFDYADQMAAYKKKDDQGSYDRPHRLTVAFDPAKIDDLLVQLGDKPWRGERPVIVPVLLVHGRKPPVYVLSAETQGGDDQRWSFGNAADAYGLQARIPSEAELAAWKVSAEHFPFAEAPPPTGDKPGEAIVAGTLEWSETLPGWIGKWRYRRQGVDHQWSISGVNYDAAFRDLVRGVVLLASGRGSPD